MVARFLSKYDLNILLIDKESNVGMGTSASNSAAVHAGYNALPGTNKAITNSMAIKMRPQFAKELNIPYERCGDYVVAVNDEDMAMLEVLLARGKTNGVCNPFEATIAAAENAVMNGVEVRLNTAFEDFIMEGDTITGIRTNQGDFECRWVVNAAGLYADEVTHKAGVRPEFTIRPRRGEYVILDKADFQLTHDTILFPTPLDKGKGIAIASSTHGNVIVGPNANFVEDKTNKDVTPEGVEEIWSGGEKLVPSINREYIIADLPVCGPRVMPIAPIRILTIIRTLSSRSRRTSTV